MKEAITTVLMHYLYIHIYRMRKSRDNPIVNNIKLISEVILGINTHDLATVWPPNRGKWAKSVTAPIKLKIYNYI